MSTRESWFILGGSSAMARVFARLVAAQGADVFLAGRDHDDLSRSAADLRACYSGEAEAVDFDALDPASRARLVTRIENQPGIVNIALMFGIMPAQEMIDAKPEIAGRVIDAGFTAAVLVLHALAPDLEKRGCGSMIVVGSVAGDRGRLPNYVYGAAKAGLATYLAGLRNRMARRGVHVMTVKPGFVDTAMTWGLKLPMAASPEMVAETMLKAVARKTPILYVPWFWQYIMLVIKHIPERVFMRLKI
jgi:NAD(P)-dependent dehydrogenase (short-subunit alcohol dehydrogenase family)